MRAYSIITPPWETTSGGIRVMYGLYGWLLAKGQITHLNAKYVNNDFIAIYPEIINGNPAGANKVVRYILNRPGVMGTASQGEFQSGPTEFASTDMLYYFSRLFGDTDESHYMFLPILDLHLWKDYGKMRTKKAVFIGKGVNTGVHPKDCIEITRTFADDQQALADLLNKCQVLYCYDPVSAMTEIARLCGCRVVMVPSTYTKDEFKNYEAGMNGMSWGIEENVPLDVKGFRKHYRDMRRQFGWKLDKFITETQST